MFREPAPMPENTWVRMRKSWRCPSCGEWWLFGATEESDMADTIALHRAYHFADGPRPQYRVWWVLGYTAPEGD